jgi:hypothetical protein
MRILTSPLGVARTSMKSPATTGQDRKYGRYTMVCTVLLIKTILNSFNNKAIRIGRGNKTNNL